MGFNSGFKGLMKLEFPYWMFEENSNFKRHKNPPSGRRVTQYKQSDRHNEANSPFSQLREQA